MSDQLKKETNLATEETVEVRASAVTIFGVDAVALSTTSLEERSTLAGVTYSVKRIFRQLVNVVDRELKWF